MFIKFEEIQRMSDQIREMTGDDQDTFLDTLDGETDAMDILGKLIQAGRDSARLHYQSRKSIHNNQNKVRKK